MDSNATLLIEKHFKRWLEVPFTFRDQRPHGTQEIRVTDPLSNLKLYELPLWVFYRKPLHITFRQESPDSYDYILTVTLNNYHTNDSNMDITVTPGETIMCGLCGPLPQGVAFITEMVWRAWWKVALRERWEVSRTLDDPKAILIDGIGFNGEEVEMVIPQCKSNWNLEAWEYLKSEGLLR